MTMAAVLAIATRCDQLKISHAVTNFMQLVGVVVAIGENVTLDCRTAKQAQGHDSFILVHRRHPPRGNGAICPHNCMDFVAFGFAARSSSIACLSVFGAAAYGQWLTVNHPDDRSQPTGSQYALLNLI